MKKIFILLSAPALMTIPIDLVAATGTAKSLLTLALENRGKAMAPLPIMTASSQEEDNQPHVASPVERYLQHPDLIPPHLKAYLASNANLITEDMLRDEQEANTSGSIPIPGYNPRLRAQSEAFAKALQLAAKIEKQLTPKTASAPSIFTSVIPPAQ